MGLLRPEDEKLRKLPFLIIVIIIAGGLAACSLENKQLSSYYMVDPRFSDLYQNLHGEKVLGPPISNKKYVAETNQEKQYFESGVLVYDPDAAPSYYLHPVGADAGFSDIPNQDPENPAVRYLNGYIIPQEFARLYDELGGERWVGRPLTRARYNPEKNTIEQYFENLGFFRYEEDPPGTVHFMPYGLWKCAGECAMYPGVENASLSSSAAGNLSSPFSEAISRLGTSFTGSMLSGPYQAADGHLEQVFENVVLYQHSSSPLGVKLRPIVPALKIEEDKLQKKSSQSDAYFREVSDGKGFSIPDYFLAFINQSAGFELSGEPVSRSREIRSGVFRQCFENYCLLYDEAAPAESQVQLMPLGQKYREQISRSQAVENQPRVDQKRTQLDIWEQSPQISSQERQQVGACVHQGDQAVSGIEPRLTVQVDGNEKKNYTFHPTDEGGCSFIELEPIRAQNGIAVEYQVCITDAQNQTLCEHDSFVIWGNHTKPPEEIQSSDQQPGEPSSAESPGVVLDLWEVSQQISSSESQEIGACIHAGTQPLSGLAAELTVSSPQGERLVYQAAPTDGGGCSFFKLDPVEAKNGESIPYQVCFFKEDGGEVCQKGNFLIWENP